MMNQNNGWMGGGWGSGGAWVWIVLGTLVAVLLVAAILKLAKK